jgi:uncharacterized membrane protein (DUF106 family)
MNFKKDLQDANVKSAIVSSLLFFVLAFPELFQAVDSLLRIVFGKFDNMHMVVLVIHSVLFGVLFYYINQFLQKRVLVEARYGQGGESQETCSDKCDDLEMGSQAQNSCLRGCDR